MAEMLRTWWVGVGALMGTLSTIGGVYQWFVETSGWPALNAADWVEPWHLFVLGYVTLAVTAVAAYHKLALRLDVAEGRTSRPYAESIDAFDIAEDGTIGTLVIRIARDDAVRMTGLSVAWKARNIRGQSGRTVDLIPDGTGRSRGEVMVTDANLRISRHLTLSIVVQNGEGDEGSFEYRCLPGSPIERSRFVRVEDNIGETVYGAVAVAHTSVPKPRIITTPPKPGIEEPESPTSEEGDPGT